MTPDYQLCFPNSRFVDPHSEGKVDDDLADAVFVRDKATATA